MSKTIYFLFQLFAKRKEKHGVCPKVPHSPDLIPTLMRTLKEFKTPCPFSDLQPWFNACTNFFILIYICM